MRFLFMAYLNYTVVLVYQMKLSCCLECVCNSHPDYNHYFILFRLLKNLGSRLTSQVDMKKNLNMQPGFIIRFEGEIF